VIKLFSFFSLVVFAVSTLLFSVSTQAYGTSLSNDEKTLANLINQYRIDNGLSAIPVTQSLTAVSQIHSQDLVNNFNGQPTDPNNSNCNLHSWSSNYFDGYTWDAMCYTSDHAQAQEMWDKPREITNNTFTGNGYENAYWSSGNVTPEGALNGWKTSTGHNNVILNQDIWASKTWNSLGVGILGNYAVMWVSDSTDPQGTLDTTVNRAPSVSITSPTNSQQYTDPANITINANASDSDGTVTKVEFYNGTTKIGEDTNGGDGWSYTWSNVSAGSYSLKVKAFDNDGASTDSGTVNIVVNNPVANQAPSVSISSPNQGKYYSAPANITINANASDSDGTVTKVEFYNGASR